MAPPKLVRFLLFISILLITTVQSHSRGTEGQASAEKEVTLQELVSIAVEQNPEIKSSELTAAASRAIIPAAGALPDPTVTFEHMGDLVPLRLQAGDPSSARTYGIEQEIPFPGKRGLKEKIASAEARGQDWNRELTRRKVVAELKQSFFDLYLIRKSIEVLMKNKGLLENFETIAQSRYQVGQTIQQDVLKAQIEQSKVLDRLLILGQRKKISEAKINQLLYRSPESPVGKPADFDKAELAYSVEELTQLAVSGSPELKSRDIDITRGQHGVELAQKEYFPDFSVGFTYFDRRDMPEMYGLMIKAKLPLYFWTKQRPELESARLNLSSARTMRDSTSSTVIYQVKEAYTLATTAERLAKLYSSAIVPQANLTLDSGIANYQVGKIDFLQLIDSSMALLEYELKYYEAMIEFHKALARLEPLTGLELTK